MTWLVIVFGGAPVFYVTNSKPVEESPANDRCVLPETATLYMTFGDYQLKTHGIEVKNVRIVGKHAVHELA